MNKMTFQDKLQANVIQSFILMLRKKLVKERHLFMTVAEAYKLFREKYPDECIEKLKFAELRPKHVFLSSDLPVSVCTCRYH